MSKLFPYADVNAESIASVYKVARMFTDTATPPENLGFHLINGTLVSNTFLVEVECELLPLDRLNCHEVTKVTDLFDCTFLDSLTALEWSVLGECVLLLIEMGNVSLNLINKKNAA